MLATSLVLANCSVTISTSRPANQPLVAINPTADKDAGKDRETGKDKTAEKADVAASTKGDENRPSKSAPGATDRPAQLAALPPSSKPGECFAQVLLPARYKTFSERVLVRAGTTAYEPVDAKVVRETKRIKVRDEQVTYQRVPARYKWVEKQVEIKPAVYKTVTTPTKYAERKVRVLVRPERQAWRTKRGRVVADRGTATGVILQRVTIPAEYKIVKQRIVVEPAKARKVLVTQAKYETVRQRVLVSPERVIEKKEPAVYRTVSVEREVSPTSQRPVAIPPVYKTVQRRELVEDERYAWKAVKCEVTAGKPKTTGSKRSNAPSKRLVRKIQNKLKRMVLYFGDIDGQPGRKTMAAVHVYQAMFGLPVGPLTRRTIVHMGLIEGQKAPRPRQDERRPVRPYRSS